MRKEVLEEMISKWEEKAIEPDTADGSKEAEIPNAKESGECKGRYKCAQDLKQLVSLLG